MKKVITLILTFLAVTGCQKNNAGSQPGTSKDTSSVDDESSIAEPMIKSTAELDKLGLREIDRYPNDYGRQVLRSHQHLIDYDGQHDYFTFKNYDDVTSYFEELKEKGGLEYGHDYYDALCFFRNLNPKKFDQADMFVFPEMTLPSSANYYTFEGVYRKDRTLYCHLYYYDCNTFGHSGTADIIYESCVLFLSKDYAKYYDDLKVIIDNYLPVE